MLYISKSSKLINGRRRGDASIESLKSGLEASHLDSRETLLHDFSIFDKQSYNTRYYERH